ncbi:MAG: ribbon-helix-helix domain-containing protein [Candidatus Puniceispirillales bacterium]
MIKRSMTINGHRTSISLETAFWDALQRISNQKGCSLARLVADIDIERSKKLGTTAEVGGLSSAIRLYILGELTAIAKQYDHRFF